VRLARIIRESAVEAYFVKRVAEMGGRAYKFVSPSHRGVPDRLVLWPKGLTEFVELKAPGKKATLQQMHEHEKLRKLGFTVSVLDSRLAVDEWCGSRAGAPRPQHNSAEQ
jgi:hypothetical protein